MAAIVSGIQVGFRTADQAFTSTTTLADITDLTIPVKNGGKYAFQAFIPYEAAGTASGAKFGINGPTMTNIRANVLILDATGASLITDGYVTAIAGEVVTATSNTSSAYLCQVIGTFEPSADGTLAMQFAQNSSSGSAITVKRGAWIQVVRMG